MEFRDDVDGYTFRDLLRTVLSPVAFGAMEQLSERILDIYGLETLFDTHLPKDERERHTDRKSTRLNSSH